MWQIKLKISKINGAILIIFEFDGEWWSLTVSKNFGSISSATLFCL